MVDTRETKAKLSASEKAFYQTPSGKLKRVKLSASMKGNQYSLGHCHTEETKAKLSAAFGGEKNPNYGQHLKAQTRARISAALTGERHPNYGKHLSKETRAKIGAAFTGEGNPFYGQHLSNETKAKIGKKMSIISKARWQDAELRQKMVRAIIKASHTKPNNAELKLQSILEKYFPGKWKYVGDGELIIGGCCPDFVNTDDHKKVIELFGDYWHPMFDIAKKKEHYKQYGFKVAIIWEDELRDEIRLVNLLKARNGKFSDHIR